MVQTRCESRRHCDVLRFAEMGVAALDPPYGVRHDRLKSLTQQSIIKATMRELSTTAVI